jgi:radical SAM superfamily enzyme YgiQ (UPF0313 family)
VESAKSLAAQGVKELIFIAQDLTYYGLDIYKKRNLAELIEKIAEVEGIEWIRLHYAFPAGFPMDVLDVMSTNPKVCNYLDMPLQHGSTKILKAMRRGITREKTEELVNEIRAKVPNIALRTTLIAGYPGETEEDFQEMYEFVERMRFDRLGIFTYSHEENTHAHNFEDDVPDDLKREIFILAIETSYAPATILKFSIFMFAWNVLSVLPNSISNLFVRGFFLSTTRAVNLPSLPTNDTSDTLRTPADLMMCSKSPALRGKLISASGN